MDLLELKEKITRHLIAGYPGLFIQSGEESRVDAMVAEVADALLLSPKEWNLGYGWVDFFNKQPRDGQERSIELAQSLPALLDDDLDGKLIVIKDARAALENQPLATARLKQLLNRIQRHHRAKAAVVLVSETLHIPASIEAQITLLPLMLPRGDEIAAQIDEVSQGLELRVPDALRQRLIAACSGLSHEEIRSALAMLRQQCEQVDESALALIQREKEQIIAKSGVLEMVKVSESASDIGGLENLKSWLNRRAEIFRRLDKAAVAGIPSPKGVLIAGMPGCGKSLTAKAAAGIFQLPLLRLDIGSLLGKYVGESEHNMRRALTMAETVSPCILWIDELEKAFVGMNSSSGSEVSSRLFGYFLTWMQEKSGAVFVIATANNITALPPELLRKGRFDDVFYVGFPNAGERGEILNIYLKKDGLALTEQQHDALVAQCRDYAGADIQNAINEAREAAFLDNGTPLTCEHIESSIQRTVPLRETLRDQVNKYEELFEKLKLKPASKIDGLSVAQMIKMVDDPNALRRGEVARNPDCPDDLLEKLAQDPEIDIRKAVYQNPNCPERLLTLRINILDNHAGFDLDLLHQACVHQNAPHDLLAAQFDRLKLTPGHKLLLAERSGHDALHGRLLADRDPAIHRHLARNRALSTEVQKRLAADTRSEIREDLAGNETLHPDIQALLSRDGDDLVREALADLKSLTEAVQLSLAKDDNIDVRICLARRGDQAFLPDAVQLELAKDDPDVRRALARNDSLGAGAQQMLAEDAREEVRRALAGNPCLVSTTLQLLAADTQSVQTELAGNRHLGVTLQMALSESEVEDVRAALADNAQLCSEAQIRLARDASVEVRRNLAANRALTEAALEILMHDENDQVRERLMRRGRTVPAAVQRHLAQDANVEILVNLAASAELAADVQQSLGNGPPEVRRALAANRVISIQAQQLLLERGDIETRRRLAGNPMLDAPLQARLAEDSDKETRRVLAGNSALAMPVAEKLIGDSADIQEALAGNEKLSESQYDRLFKQGSDDVRVLLAGNPHVGEALMAQILRSQPTSGSTEKFRFALAKNPKIPASLQDAVSALNDGSEAFFIEFAANPSLLEGTQLALAGHASPRVREVLAANENLSLKVQKILLKDKAVLVRSGLVRKNGWMAAEVEWTLAEDENVSARLALAACDGLRRRTQLVLAQDRDAKVRARLVEQRDSFVFRGIGRKAQEMLAKDRDEKVRLALAAYGGLELSAQRILATDASVNVRKRLAKGNDNRLFTALGEDAQFILAHDKDAAVRLELAEQPGLSSEVQCRLAADPDRSVKLRLLQAHDFLHPLSIPAQLQFVRDPDSEIREALINLLFGILDVPSAEEVYSALSEDQEGRERIIRNLVIFRRWGKVSESLKQLLLKDAPAGKRASLDAIARDREDSREEVDTGEG
ncbi:AAA family ATPase [Achromobacter sp. Marseille-Q0513]|uniref:AAA family ATPase n=1 Tax=Achromobacter sp. Marseille-Q0513 TaxID=2829161 RepID=UPI001BA29E0F|nr:AAA family ATPase [Achromobacter sp. Marseille-Q0513]MBR8655818.1 AAA family ATPase [Achromobacter sp. Marseille-Q0513]